MNARPSAGSVCRQSGKLVLLGLKTRDGGLAVRLLGDEAFSQFRRCDQEQRQFGNDFSQPTLIPLGVIFSEESYPIPPDHCCQESKAHDGYRD